MKTFKTFEQFVTEDLVPGGVSDGMSLGDIAKKHGVDLAEIEVAYAKGTKVEMEHTSDENLAMEIARDHLLEDPEYYTKLATIEKD